ncbi:MAG: hypothetical protein F2547_02985, partial [Actinobacteria bacterium]|nr:hypothetical protein [Actinomycetota bacterium]
MASQAVAILSVFGVLGTAGAAMAVNSDTLAGATDAALGNATSVLVPSGTEDPASTEAGSPAPAPISSTTLKKIVVQGPAPAPGASTPIQVAPSVPVDQPPTDGTTGGSGYGDDDYD